MKKLFALALIAGSLSFFACNNDKNGSTDNDGTDTTKVENNNTTIENNNTTVDSTNMNNNMGTDSSKMNNGTDTSATKKM